MLKSLFLNFLLFIFLFCINLYSIDFQKFDVYGETNYSEKENKSLNTTLNFEYKLHIYEPNHKKYLIYIGGKLSPDYDHFNNELKINNFTTIGIDF
jgi:hypothetical protein